jgi:hypothetical protein
MFAVAPPQAISAPATPAEVRHSAAVLWSGGTSYRLSDPESKRSALLVVASFGGRTRLQLTTPQLVIWLGGIESSATPTFVCIKVPPEKASCDPPQATRTTAQQAILEATRPLIEYSKLIAPKALSGARVRVTSEVGYPVGCLQGHSTTGLGAVKLCTTRDGLLTEVSYKGVKVLALSVKPVITAADLARPG